MNLQKYKKLKLITLLVLVFIFTILIMTIGLLLIAFAAFNHDSLNFIELHWKQKFIVNNITNGFSLLNYMSINYLFTHSASYICSINDNYQGYYDWIQLQIGVIFCVILVPIFAFVTISLTFLIIGLKIKIENNNFWDGLQNCEIINNYYIH
ncbi:hypothetical protein [Spiroplasma endosymbiont of Polydrusus pterygomalis]|uniref:hypothetical protein n=1 Tax=Spiroplasma endosymbiont of Polydrusus pterygomalis TaxID=3139327 RepID=UPI003CCA7814